MNGHESNDIVLKEIFLCHRCGKCCLEIPVGSVLQEDIDRWRKQRRKSILRFIDIDTRAILPRYEVFDVPCSDYNNRCPWIMKVRNANSYKCKIHDTKPVQCRNFPFLANETINPWALENCPSVKIVQNHKQTVS
jgi:Fe-S-cluster containining protein